MPKKLSRTEARRIVAIAHAKTTPEQKSEKARKMNKARWDAWRANQLVKKP